MMHYRKGENVESELKKEDLPFDDCMPKGKTDFLWMQVKGGTKVSNVMTYAKNALNSGEYRTIVWTGAGGGVVKTVSCAEILKRSHPMYQVTRLCYKNIEEHWTPLMEGLDEIIVNRQIPCLHILMSLDEIEDHLGEVQKPNTVDDIIKRGHAAGMLPNRSIRNLRGNNRGFRGGQQQRNQNQSHGEGEKRSGKRPFKHEGGQREKPSDRNQQETPKRNQHETPKRNQQETPKRNQQETPNRNQQETPNRNQQKTPNANQQETPNQNQQETPKNQTQTEQQKQQQGASSGPRNNSNRKRNHRKPKLNSNNNSESSLKQQKSSETPQNQFKTEQN